MTGGLNDPRDPTVVVNEFLPSSVTVRSGTEVTWEMAGPEPHSVTFVPPGSQTPPSLETDPSLLLPTPATAPYDGTAFVNSGVAPLGKNVAALLDVVLEAGALHVLLRGAPTDGRDGHGEQLPTAVGRRSRSRGHAQRVKYLAEGRAAKAKLLAARPTPTRNTDGTTTYRVTMGASTLHTEILAFAPSPKQVREGDHITFVNDSGAPHTASFGGPLVPLNPEVDEVRQAAPGPSPQSLSSDAYLNTGWLPPKTDGTPERQRSYTFDAPNPGMFAYVCVLHSGSGMAGEIAVGS